MLQCNRARIVSRSPLSVDKMSGLRCFSDGGLTDADFVCVWPPGYIKINECLGMY